MDTTGTRQRWGISGFLVFVFLLSGFSLIPLSVNAEYTEHTLSSNECVALCNEVKDGIVGYEAFFKIFMRTHTDGFLHTQKIVVASFDRTSASSTAMAMHNMLPQASCFVDTLCSSNLSVKENPLRITSLECFERAKRLCFSKIARHHVAVIPDAQKFFQDFRNLETLLENTLVVVEAPSPELKADNFGNVLFASSRSAGCNRLNNCYVAPGSAVTVGLIATQVLSIWPDYDKKSVFTLFKECGDGSNALSFACFLDEDVADASREIVTLELAVSREITALKLRPYTSFLAGNSFAPWRERADFEGCPVALSLCGGIQTYFRHEDIDSYYYEIVVDMAALERTYITFSAMAAAALVANLSTAFFAAPVFLPLAAAFTISAASALGSIVSILIKHEGNPLKVRHDINLSQHYILEEGGVPGYGESMSSLLQRIQEETASPVDLHLLTSDGAISSALTTALGGRGSKKIWCVNGEDDCQYAPIKITAHTCGAVASGTQSEVLEQRIKIKECVKGAFSASSKVLQIDHTEQFVKNYIPRLTQFAFSDDTVLILPAAKYEDTAFLEEAAVTGQVIFVTGGGKLPSRVLLLRDSTRVYLTENDFYHSESNECVAQKYFGILAALKEGSPQGPCVIDRDISPGRSVISELSQEGVLDEYVLYKNNPYAPGPIGEVRELKISPSLRAKLAGINLSIDQFSPETLALLARVPPEAGAILEKDIPAAGSVQLTDNAIPGIEREIREKLAKIDLYPAPIENVSCDADETLQEMCIAAPARLVSYTEDNIYVDTNTKWLGPLASNILYSSQVSIVTAGVAMMRSLWPDLSARSVVSTVFSCAAAAVDDERSDEEKGFVGRGLFSMDCESLAYTGEEKELLSIPDWQNMEAYDSCPVLSSTCGDLVVRIADPDDATREYSVTFNGINGFTEFVQTYKILNTAGTFNDTRHHISVLATSQNGLGKIATFFRVDHSTAFACRESDADCLSPIKIAQDACLTTCGENDSRTIRVVYVDEKTTNISDLLQQTLAQDALLVLSDETFVTDADFLTTERILVGVGDIQYEEHVFQGSLTPITVVSSDICSAHETDADDAVTEAGTTVTVEQTAAATPDALGIVCTNVKAAVEASTEKHTTLNCEDLQLGTSSLALCEDLSTQLSARPDLPPSVATTILPKVDAPQCQTASGYCVLLPDVLAQYDDGADRFATITKDMAAPSLAAIAGMFFSLWPDVETRVMVSLIKENCLGIATDGVSTLSLRCLVKDRATLGWNVLLSRHETVSTEGYTSETCRGFETLCTLASTGDPQTYVPGLKNLLKGARVAWFIGSNVQSASLLSVGGDVDRTSPFIGDYACIVTPQTPDCTALVKVTNEITLNPDQSVDNFTTVRISDPALLVNLEQNLQEKTMLILGANYGKVVTVENEREETKTPTDPTPSSVNVLGPNEIWALPPTNPNDYPVGLRPLAYLSVKYNISIAPISTATLASLAWLDWASFSQENLLALGTALAKLTETSLRSLAAVLDGQSEASVSTANVNTIIGVLEGKVRELVREQGVTVRVRKEEEEEQVVDNEVSDELSLYNSLSELYDTAEDAWKTNGNVLFVTPHGTTCGEGIDYCISAPDAMIANKRTVRGVSSYVVAFADAIVTSLWPQLLARERIVLYKNCATPFPEGDARTGVGSFSLSCLTKDANTITIDSKDLVALTLPTSDQTPSGEQENGAETAAPTPEASAKRQAQPEIPVPSGGVASYQNAAAAAMGSPGMYEETAASFVTRGFAGRKGMQVIVASPQISLSYMVMSGKNKAFHALSFQHSRPWGSLSLMSGLHIEQGGFTGAYFYDPSYIERIDGIADFFLKNYRNMIMEMQETMSSVSSLRYESPSLRGLRLRVVATTAFSFVRPGLNHLLQRSQGIEGVVAAVLEQSINHNNFAHTTLTAEGHCRTGIYGTFQIAYQIFNMTTQPKCSASLGIKVSF